MKRNLGRFRPLKNKRGIALIEVLVSLLLFSLGILGMVGLQAQMTRAQSSMKYRSDAAQLGAEAIGSMWADQPNLVKYNATTCLGYPRCSDFTAKVISSLPQGSTTISTTASGAVGLTISWSTNAEGTHSYVLATNIGS